MTENAANSKCCYCNEEKDASGLRPYGPDGAYTCFNCAVSTPERKDIAEQKLNQVFEAPGSVCLITEEGIRPISIADLMCILSAKSGETS